MRTFIVIWIGQTTSIIGSSMTSFAVTIWAWDLASQVTALALIGFFTQVPRVLIAAFAGVIVDRWNRKFLMIAGDIVAGICTIAILLLYLTNTLQISHLYVASAVNSVFGHLQWLSYSASLSMIVPKQQYSRATSIDFLASYGAGTFAPALAGVLYHIIGFVGILTIDIITFVIAISTMLFVTIPQPSTTEIQQQDYTGIYQEIIFGFRYIFTRPSLLAILVSASLFWFAHDLGEAIYSPMILARSGNDAGVLGKVFSAAGVGGILGAVIVSTWGGPKRRINGLLLGMIGAGLSKIVFGLTQIPSIWILTQLCSSLNFPLLGSSSSAIWLAKVRPDVQGRVFAARSLIVLLTSAIAYLIAGPLADHVFEPAITSGSGFLGIFSGLFGTGPGAGMALLYVTSAICLLLIGVGGYTFRVLRDVEIIVPDHDAT